MAIITEEGITKITCDKCGFNSIAPTKLYNEVFYNEGWVLNRGKKYMHLCNRCLTKKQREAMKFIKEKFPVTFK